MVDSPLQAELRRRMVALGSNQKSLARKAGLNETAVRDILQGRSRSPRIDTLEAIARALSCTVHELTGHGEGPPHPDKTDRIDVIGSIDAAIRIESIVRAAEDWYQVDIPKDPRFRDRPRFGIEVHGEAASRFYRDGDLLICVHPEELDRELAAGDRLLVRMGDNDDREFQFMVGEYQTDKEGQSWLWLGSGGDGRISKSDEPDIETIAVVVGSFRQE
jgi:transcriptional regulator with XRE-family HTH domain